MPIKKTHLRTLRRSRTLPWGYKVSKYDPDILEPIPELVELLDIAERAWKAKTVSQEDIARWVTDRAYKAGYDWPISKLGLKKRLFVTPKNINKFGFNVSEKAFQAYTKRDRPSEVIKVKHRSKTAGQQKKAKAAQRTAKAS